MSNGAVPIRCSLTWQGPFDNGLPVRKIGDPSNVQIDLSIERLDPNEGVEFQLVNFRIDPSFIKIETDWIEFQISADLSGRYSHFDTTRIDDRYQPGTWDVNLRLRDRFGHSVQVDCVNGPFKIVSPSTITKEPPPIIISTTCPPGTEFFPAASPQFPCVPIITTTPLPSDGVRVINGGNGITPINDGGNGITPINGRSVCDSPCRVEGDFCRCPEVVPAPKPIPLPILPRDGIPRERLPIKAEISPFAVIGSAALFLFFLATRRRKGR